MVDLGLNRRTRAFTEQRRKRPHVRSRLLFASLWTLSCASPEAVRPAPAPGVAAETEPPGGFGDDFGAVAVRGQELSLLLPDPEHWRVDPTEKYSWVARHRASDSVLLARVWHTDAIVHAEDCERQARTWRPELPWLSAAEIVQASTARLAGDYDSRLTVGVRSSAEASQPIGFSGHVLAFGSAARSCLLLAFSTSARGPGARRSIADRLASIVPTTFLRARHIGIEHRVAVPAR